MITRTARSGQRVDVWEFLIPGIGFEIPQGPILGMDPRPSGDSVKKTMFPGKYVPSNLLNVTA